MFPYNLRIGPTVTIGTVEVRQKSDGGASTDGGGVCLPEG